MPTRSPVRSLWLGLWAAGAASLLAGDARAVTLRVQVDQRGDFVLVGNTLGHDCGPTTPLPVVGTVGNCGTLTDDDTPDVFWRSDEPALGQALADASIAVDQARSSAVLSLPAGASVTHAFLYWGAKFDVAADGDATFERPGAFSQTVTAVDTFVDPVFPIYQSVADVTALVQQNGAGVYRVGGVGSWDFVDFDDVVQFAAWSLVVFYQLDSEPPRNLALFDGLDTVGDAAGQSIALSGFLVPPSAAFDGKLGVIAYEGDNQGTGDQLSWDGNVLSNALNPPDNFFNGTRSFLGAPAFVAGDLPQLTGTAQSTSGVDLDVVDITPYLSPGQTSAAVHASTSGEIYWLGAFLTSVSTYAPDFGSSAKSAVDLDGGALLAGDEVEYTLVVTNTGSDTSVGTVLTDVLPSQVTLVPGTIEITAGPNAGAKTDATGDDQADFEGATGTLVVRLGAGADASQGGSLAIGESTTVVFRVAIDAAATGAIENQATITAGGALGAAPSSTPTDGNGAGVGSPPTTVFVDECGVDADCGAPKPFCDTTQTPNVCVECTSDAQCPALLPTCDPATHACVCVASGPELCGNAVDENCDGSLVEGCGGGGAGGGGGAAGAGGEGGAAGAGGSGGGPGGSGGNGQGGATGGGAPAGGGGATPGSGGSDLGLDGTLEGGGCDCGVVREQERAEGRALLGLALVASAALRRRRRRSDG